MKFKMLVTMTFELYSDTTLYGETEITPQMAAKIEAKKYPEDLLMCAHHSKIKVKIDALSNKVSSGYVYKITIPGTEEKFQFRASSDGPALLKAEKIMEKFAKEDGWTYIEYSVFGECGDRIGGGCIEIGDPFEN